MKEIIILKDNGGRLANQLWNYASIYAYCLEKGYICTNYAFFRYHHYFSNQRRNIFERLIFIFHGFHKHYKLSKVINFFIYRLVTFFCKKKIITDLGQDFYLPPSTNTDTEQNKIIERMEKDDKNCYLVGWLFRNPQGLKKWHHEVTTFFEPQKKYLEQILKSMNILRQTYKFVVGVHIRQGDYKTWQGGKYFYTCQDVAPILRDFLDKQKFCRPEEVVFVICSDGDVDESVFQGLHIARGPGSEVNDLYMLSKADIIIGSNSTYGTWAAYYGQIPFFEFSRENINWDITQIPS